MNKHEKIAAGIFKQYGLKFETAERAGGWTNNVWLNDNVVLRLSNEKDGDRIHREAERTKTLPSLVGYPNDIAVGVADGYEWSLSERIQGQVLSSVWNKLSWNEKAAAVRQIIIIMDGVHSVAANRVEHLTLKTAWYNQFDRNSFLNDIERYVTQKIFTPEQGRILCDIVERFYIRNTCAAPVLCHGDITPDNLLWYDGNVISLLDFEHSVIAPRQLDIHSLVNLALVPYDENTSTDVILMEEKQQDIQQYVEEMISLFLPYLSEQYEKDLFMGYNVLFRQRFLEFWLENPKGRIEQCDAYQKLLSFSDWSCGYLLRLLK